MSVESAIGAMQEWLRGQPRTLWPNIVAVAGKWSLAYLTPEGTPRSNQMEGAALGLARVERDGNVEPLVDI